MRPSSWTKADIFRRIPKDLTEATLSGAVISILCVVVMCLLFAGEVVSYVFPRTHSDMVISRSSSEDRLKVFLDVEFHRLPCAVVSIDIVDTLQNHEVGSSKNLKLTPLALDGTPATEATRAAAHTGPDAGCRVEGFILVTKVPGNFHVSAHGRQAEYRKAFPNGQMLLGHTIHKLSFEPMIAQGPYRYAENGSRPLEGVAFKEGTPRSYQYVLDVVPTIYGGALSDTHTYQYTFSANSYALHGGHMPQAMFSYQLSPIAVRYSSGRVPFTHFIVYMCAIVGGVYTVAGLLSRFVYNSTSELQKRILGKGD